MALCNSSEMSPPPVIRTTFRQGTLPRLSLPSLYPTYEKSSRVHSRPAKCTVRTANLPPILGKSSEFQVSALAPDAQIALATTTISICFNIVVLQSTSNWNTRLSFELSRICRLLVAQDLVQAAPLFFPTQPETAGAPG